MLTKELKVDEDGSYSLGVNQDGIIYSVSKDFEKISGFSSSELIGKKCNLFRHPYMPKIIFKILWEKLNNNESFIGMIVNHTKTGEYYWLANKIYLFSREKDGSCKYFSYKTSVSKHAKFHIKKLYDKLIIIEKEGGVDASEKYLKEYLEKRGVNYDEYMEALLSGGSMFALKVGLFATKKLFK